MKRFAAILLALLVSASAWAEFTAVQTKTWQDADGGTTITGLFDAAPTAGSLVAMSVFYWKTGSGTTTITSVVDGNGNAYTVCPLSPSSYGDSSTGQVFIVYSLSAPANASATIVVTFAVSAGYASVHGVEWSKTGSAELDGYAEATQMSATINTPTIPVTGTGRAAIFGIGSDATINSINAPWTATSTRQSTGIWSGYDSSVDANQAVSVTLASPLWVTVAGASFKETVTGPDYTVTYAGNGNTGGTAPVDAASPYGATATVTVLSPGTLTKTDATFIEWNTAANGSGTAYDPLDTFAMPAANRVLYAQWTASGEQIYVAQTAAGADDGSSAANAKSAAWFNTAGSWGAGAAKISAGDTVHLSGTITTSLVVQASGSAGSPVTITFESGAKLSKAYWGTGASSPIYGSGKSYITIDGGTNGIIESTANGTALANKIDSAGIYIAGGSNWTIHDLTIRNLYVRTADSDDSRGFGKAIVGIDSSYLSIYDNVITAAYYGTYIYASTANRTGLEIYGNTITRCSTGVVAALAGPVNYSDISIHDNEITEANYWDGSFGGQWFHNDGIHIWGRYPANTIGPLYIYNNHIHGDWGAHTTAWIFIEDYADQVYIYNNLLTTTAEAPSNGFITPKGRKANATIFIYNNTIKGAGTTNIGGNGIGYSDTGVWVADVANNIFTNLYLGQYAAGAITLTSDYNDYYQVGTVGRLTNTWYTTLAQWQATGKDSHAISTNPLFVDSTNFRLQTGSPAIGTGVNKSAIFTIDIDGTARTSTWDMGAYEYAGAATYSVTYHANGATSGTVPTDASSPYNASELALVLDNTGNLAKTGHTFDDWNTASDGSGMAYAADETFAVSMNTVLYAQWAINSYTVTYDGNGNTGGAVPTDANSPHVYDTTVTTAANTGSLTKTDNFFSGWNDAANGTGTARPPGSTWAMPAANTVLYAQWSAVATYSVTYDTNGATGGSVPVDGSAYEAAATVTVLGNTGALTRGGYTWSTWNTQADGAGTDRAPDATFEMPAANTTLYAKWAVNTHTVTYLGNGNTGGTAPVDASSPYNYGATVTIAGPGDLAKTGHTFGSWNISPTGGFEEFVPAQEWAMQDADLLLYAQWIPDTALTVTYDGNGFTGGTVPVDSNPFYIEGATVTVLPNSGALVRTGHVLAGWNDAADGSGTAYNLSGTDTFLMPAASVTLYAQWTAYTYTVTYDANGADSGAVPVDAGSPHEYGSTVTVAANTGNLVKAGYMLLFWNTASDGSGITRAIGGVFSMPAANTTLYAIWGATGTASVTTVGGGGGSKAIRVIMMMMGCLALGLGVGWWIGRTHPKMPEQSIPVADEYDRAAVAELDDYLGTPKKIAPPDDGRWDVS